MGPGHGRLEDEGAFGRDDGQGVVPVVVDQVADAVKGAVLGANLVVRTA